jgi:hypothetical protein
MLEVNKGIGVPSLHRATITGKLPIVQALLTHPAIEVNNKNSDFGRSSLHWAIKWEKNNRNHPANSPVHDCLGV